MQKLRLFFAMALLKPLRRINAIVASCWIYFTTTTFRRFLFHCYSFLISFLFFPVLRFILSSSFFLLLRLRTWKFVHWLALDYDFYPLQLFCFLFLYFLSYIGLVFIHVFFDLTFSSTSSFSLYLSFVAVLDSGASRFCTWYFYHGGALGKDFPLL